MASEKPRQGEQHQTGAVEAAEDLAAELDRWHKLAQPASAGGPGQRPRLVWRIRDWPIYEPPARYRRGKPSPLKYLRRFVADSDCQDRSTYELLKDAIIRIGGLELWAIRDLLLDAAANRSAGRGYLLDQCGRPASAAQIGKLVGLEVRQVRRALAQLARPEIGQVERVRMPQAELLGLPAGGNGQAAQIAPGGRRAAHSGPSGPGGGQRASGAVGAPSGSLPGPESGSEAGPGHTTKHGENGGQRGDASCQSSGSDILGQDLGRPCPNSDQGCPLNVNWQLATGQREPLTLASAESGSAGPTARPGNGDAQQNGNAKLQGDGQIKGDVDGEGNGRSAPTTQPPPESRPAPAADGQPVNGDGGGEGPSRPPPAALSAGRRGKPVNGGGGGEGQRPPRPPSACRDGPASPLAEALCDETGKLFAVLIWRALRMPAAMSARDRGRNMGAFSAAWQRACTEVREAYRAAGQEEWLEEFGWPEWFGEWGERRLRRAERIDGRKHKPADRARIWQADFRRSLKALMDRHGPVIEVTDIEVTDEENRDNEVNCGE